MIAVEISLVLLVPFGAALGTMWLCRWWRLPAEVAWAVAIALGYTVGHIGLAAQADVQLALVRLLVPLEARQWMPWFLMLSAGWTVLLRYAPPSWRWVVFSLAVALTVALPLRLLGGSIYVTTEWSLGEKLLQLTLLAACLGCAWWLLATARPAAVPTARATSLVLVAGGTALVLALSGSIVHGELGLMASAAIAGTMCGAIPLRRQPTGAAATSYMPSLHGAAGVLAMLFGSLLVLGHYYAELSASNAALLALAATLAGGRLPALLERGPTWQQSALRLAICLLPLVVAVVRAISHATSAATDNPYL